MGAAAVGAAPAAAVGDAAAAAVGAAAVGAAAGVGEPEAVVGAAAAGRADAFVDPWYEFVTAVRWMGARSSYLYKAG